MSTMDGGAYFSNDRRYRYNLWRTWDPELRKCCFVGLNPSTADEQTDDPTIRKCIGFAQRWGFGAIDMINLFAWRATKPAGLLEATREKIDIVGAENDQVVGRILGRAGRIVWCWGQHQAAVRHLVKQRQERMGWFVVHKGTDVGTFGHTKTGCPRHPLMLPYSTLFQPL